MPTQGGVAIVAGAADNLKSRRLIMQAITAPDQLDLQDEEVLVHDWRAEQLRRLGLPAPVAEVVADLVDGHALAALVEWGCPAELALEIVY